jgi:hypothetical protein
MPTKRARSRTCEPVQRPEGWGERGVMVKSSAEYWQQCIEVPAYNSKP